MGDVINFRQARKDLARKAKEETAAQNRVAFGRSKAVKLRDSTTTNLAEKRLEGYRRDPGAQDDDGNKPA